MTTRNSCVSAGQVPADTSVDLYVVPSGFNFILKDVQLVQEYSATPAAVYLFLVRGGLPGVYFLVEQTTPNVPKPWSGWIVLNEGDKIGVSATGAPYLYWISGALLPVTGP